MSHIHRIIFAAWILSFYCGQVHASGLHRLRILGDGTESRATIVNNELPLVDVPSKCKSSKSIAQNLVVVARHKEDISWLVEKVDVPFLAYQSENTSRIEPPVRVHRSGALEANAYLQFIAEYYDCLPEVTAFLHAHRSSWHSEDMVKDLAKLKWDSVAGYMPLHQPYFQPFGMFCRMNISDPEKELKTVLATGDDAYNSSFTHGQIVNDTAYVDYEVYHYRQAQDILNGWEEFFGPAGLGAVPETIQYYCCAQFLVTKQRIQQRPREFYLQALHYAEHGQHLGFFSPIYTRGLVFESLWHIIFGEPAFLPQGVTSTFCTFFQCD